MWLKQFWRAQGGETAAVGPDQGLRAVSGSQADFIASVSAAPTAACAPTATAAAQMPPAAVFASPVAPTQGAAPQADAARPRVCSSSGAAEKRPGPTQGARFAVEDAEGGAASRTEPPPPGAAAATPRKPAPAYPPVLADVLSRVLHCCYSEAWQTRLSGSTALKMLIPKCGPVSPFASHTHAPCSPSPHVPGTRPSLHPSNSRALDLRSAVLCPALLLCVEPSWVQDTTGAAGGGVAGAGARPAGVAPPAAAQLSEPPRGAGGCPAQRAHPLPPAHARFHLYRYRRGEPTHALKNNDFYTKFWGYKWNSLQHVTTQEFEFKCLR